MLPTAIALVFIGSFLEFFEVEAHSRPKLRFRKHDISAYISGTLFGIAGLLIAIAAAW